MGTHDLVTGRTDLSISSNNRALIAEIFGSIRKSAMAGVTAIVLVTLMLAACSRSGDISSSESTSTAPSGEPSVTASSESTVIASGSDETVVESTHVGVEILCSDYGMPQIESDQHSIAVVDDDHPDLKDAVESICGEYEAEFESDKILYRLYRVDGELLSFRVTISDTNIDVGYTLNMDGEVISLQDVITGFPLSCAGSIESEIEYNIEEFGAAYDPIDLEDLSYDDVDWVIDANSIVIIVDMLPYRIPFCDNRDVISESLTEYNGEFFARYINGPLEVNGDLLDVRRGSLEYSELSQMTLSLNGENIRIAPDDLDSTMGLGTGFIYYDGNGSSLYWIRHQGWWDEFYFRELIRIESGSAEIIYMDREHSQCVYDLNDLTSMIPE